MYGGGMSSDSSSYCPESEFFQSDGFHNCDEHNHVASNNYSTFEKRKKDLLNRHLSNIQIEIYESIKYNNWEKL